MSLAITAMAMAQAGCTAEQIARVVQAHELAGEEISAKRRAKDAERKRMSRMSRGQARTPEDGADKSGSLPPYENITLPPKPPKRSSSLRSDDTPRPKKADVDVLEILKTVLSEKTALDVIDHRKAKRAQLTPRAAELLRKQFRDYGNPEAAAEAMIANGWQGFKPEWMANQTRAGPGGRSNGTIEAMRGFWEKYSDECNGKRPSYESAYGALQLPQLERPSGSKTGET